MYEYLSDEEKREKAAELMQDRAGLRPSEVVFIVAQLYGVGESTVRKWQITSQITWTELGKSKFTKPEHVTNLLKSIEPK